MIRGLEGLRRAVSDALHTQHVNSLDEFIVRASEMGAEKVSIRCFLAEGQDINKQGDWQAVRVPV